MQYKTHRQLTQSRTLLRTLDQLATALSHCHAEWMEALRARNPTSDRTQLSNQAMERATQQLRDSLSHVSEASGQEPLSLEAAMEFIRRHTPAAS
jgi:hypothetical protein